MDAREYAARQIKYLRKEKLGITAEALGNLLKPKRSSKTISSWETGRTSPDINSLNQLAEIFEESVSVFYPKEQTLIKETPFGEVPLYGTVAAGKPLAIIPVDNTHPVPTEMILKYPESFLLKVEGQSMNNILPDGSYALIDPKQNEPQDNKVYAICIDGEDATIKRVKLLENGFEFLPDSKDPTFQSIIFNRNKESDRELIIIGRVVWVMLPFDWTI